MFKKNKHHSEEHKRKISEAIKKVWTNPVIRKKISEAMKKAMGNLKIRRKLSEANKGKKLSEETKRKIGERLKGRHCAEETKEKMSLAHKGPKSSFWRGGISFEPYSVDWTKDLKRAIRKRDKYTCQICSKEPATFVHHIDYDKKNCNLNNLITLCNSCHCKTNFNRKQWLKYFRRTW